MAKKKASIKGLPKTKKYNGRNYTKSVCGKTKTEAKKTAANIRKKGGLARVVKDSATGRHCVYSRKKK